MKKQMLLVLLLALCVNTFSQSVEFRKPVVLINYFKGVGGVDAETCEAFRTSYVTEAIKMAERIQFIDVSTEDLLSEEQKRRMRDDALDDVFAKEMVQLNVDYILEATITKAVIEKKQDKDGKEKYRGELTYSVNIVSTEDASVVFTEENVITTANEQNSHDAESKLLTGAVVTCGVVETVAHLKGEMVDSEYEVDKKGKKMTKCYITLGNMHGLKKGDDYIVMAAVKIVNGHPIYEEVGEVEITEVLADDLSECKVKKNGENVLKYMKEYLVAKTSDSENAAVLRVESTCKKSLKEKLSDFDKGAKTVEDVTKTIDGLIKAFKK